MLVLKVPFLLIFQDIEVDGISVHLEELAKCKSIAESRLQEITQLHHDKTLLANEIDKLNLSVRLMYILDCSHK